MLVSADTDCGTILTLNEGPCPSLILLRHGAPRRPVQQAALLLANLPSIAAGRARARPHTRETLPHSLTNTHESEIITHGGRVRTNIDIDDDLMRAALQASGERTKRGVVECALRLLVQTHRQAGVRRLRGRVRWRGDLNQSRRERRDTGR